MQRLFNPIFRNRRFFCSKVSDLKAEVQEIVKIFISGVLGPEGSSQV